MAQTTAIDVNDLVKSATMHISITGCTKFRIKTIIGTFLIKSGIRIIGINAEIEVVE